jgi:hypothetical protein
MRTIFHQLHMQVSIYCNGAFANTRIFKSGGEELSAVGERGSAPSVFQNAFGIITCWKNSGYMTYIEILMSVIASISAVNPTRCNFYSIY